jgi:hypothetical protein
MGTISTKKELSPPSSWPESQDSNIFDAAFPRTSDDPMRDATTNAETFISPSSTQVTMPTPTLTPIDVPVRAFDSTGAVFSTTDFPTAGFSGPPLKMKKALPVLIIRLGMFISLLSLSTRSESTILHLMIQPDLDRYTYHRVSITGNNLSVLV